MSNPNRIPLTRKISKLWYQFRGWLAKDVIQDELTEALHPEFGYAWRDQYSKIEAEQKDTFERHEQDLKDAYARGLNAYDENRRRLHPKMDAVQTAFAKALNYHGADSDYRIPDFILARVAFEAIENFAWQYQRLCGWYGVDPASPAQPVKTAGPVVLEQDKGVFETQYGQPSSVADAIARANAVKTFKSPDIRNADPDPTTGKP